MLKMYSSTPIRCLTVTVLLVAGGWASTATAQSVEAVVNQMKARYQAQMEAVDTYIVETNQYTSYHRKTTRGGDMAYETETRWTGDGAGMLSGSNALTSLQPGLAYIDTLTQVASYVGAETIDGRRCHVLLIDDPTALSDDQMPAMAQERAQQGEMRLYIDAEQYVPVRIESEVMVEQDGETQTLRPRIYFSDYRTVDGLTLPWTMEMRMDNLNASISPEEREQARQSLEEMEKRMEAMPEQQRRMMEGMMKKQLDQLRTILEEGSINFAVEVQDVKVNTDLPADVFSEGNN
jgi:outer membrane lipoprotein-sorting protein